MFGQDDDDEEENEAEKEAAAKAKAKAGQKPPGFVQASTTTATASVATTLAKSPAKVAQEQEGAPYIRDAKARRKKEMDDHLEAIKRYRKEIALMRRISYTLITRHFLTDLLFQPGIMKQ